jgi:hypothetical protein
MTKLGLPVQVQAQEHTAYGFVAAIVRYYLKRNRTEDEQKT